MRQLVLCLGCATALAVSSLLIAGDDPKPATPADSSSKPAAAAALPVTEVVLYSSGVGFFERAGQVEGKSSVDLRFKVDNINDLLKSMVVQDFDGGRVTTVTYGSRDPITKTLKSFGVDLTSNPSMGELLREVRGEKVELAAPGAITGTILGVESKEEPVGKDKVAEVEYLNILTDDGLRSIPMSQIQRIKLLNAALNAELRQALEVLATGHDTQKKTVAIAFDGEGKRKVSVSYIMETPVWKTSYRLVLDDEGKPFLQGWAIVENTTDDDWSNVKLALISGRPISFTMDMYQPLYVLRPEVIPELYASLRPQTYSEAMQDLQEAGRGLEREKLQDKAAKKSTGAAGMMGGGSGAMGGGGFGGAGGGPGGDARMRANRMAAEVAAVAGEGKPGFSLQQGVQSSAAGAATGELFQYSIKTPVSLARQKSAMLPIVNQDVEGSKVSIYNQSVHAKFPLNGFRLKNTSPLHLMQGPITVFDSGTYAGDARIEDLAPGTDRLISYAMDLKTEVEPIASPVNQELVSVKIKKGVLIATRRAAEEKTYNVKNRDLKKKVVLVEHPFRADWRLLEPSEPTERTRDVYRFALDIDAGKGGRVTVKEERPIEEHVQLLNTGLDQIVFFHQQTKVSAKVKDALAAVVQRRTGIFNAATERTRREARIAEITAEQVRIRENMSKLAQNSDLYTRYVKKLDGQETEIDSLRKEIEEFKSSEAKQQKDLNDYLLALDVE